MTTISNIKITTDGHKPPADIKVTVTCEVDHTDGKTPLAYFPAQGTGTKMKNTSGDTWEASDTQMYDGSEQTIKITCNGVTAHGSFKP